MSRRSEPPVFLQGYRQPRKLSQKAILGHHLGHQLLLFQPIWATKR